MTTDERDDGPFTELLSKWKDQGPSDDVAYTNKSGIDKKSK